MASAPRPPRGATARALAPALLRVGVWAIGVALVLAVVWPIVPNAWWRSGNIWEPALHVPLDPLDEGDREHLKRAISGHSVGWGPSSNAALWPTDYVQPKPLRDR